MFFPWNTWLFFQDAPVLLQGAELGGALVLSLWAGFLDACLATAWRLRSRRPLLIRYGVILPGITLIILVTGGAARMRIIGERVASAPELRLGLVQGNVSSVPNQVDDSTARYRAASIDLLARQKADLVVWPETGDLLPRSIRRAAQVPFRPSLSRDAGPGRPANRRTAPHRNGARAGQSGRLGRSVRFGGAERKPGTREGQALNRRRPGDVGSRALRHSARRDLMAFGEYIPWRVGPSVAPTSLPRRGHVLSWHVVCHRSFSVVGGSPC